MPARIEAEEAEENIRVIRSLMEKATVYRAISAPGALLGGVLSVITAAIGTFLSGQPKYATDAFFLFPWLILLGITATANGFLLWRDAKKRGDAFISPGMKLVLSAMFPGMAAGGLCLFADCRGGLPVTASLWVLCYGISLLAAAPFAPGSIRRLGRLFFGAGAALLVSGYFLEGWELAIPNVLAHLIMGSTFGLFHLVYAACTWPRGTATSAA
jgi:hypothetical protein